MNRHEKKKIKLRNKKLVKEYPFLLPRNRFSDKIPKDYDYSYTELDAMPKGWRKRFGIQMCEDIKRGLFETGGKKYLNKYRITQIKEKYGSLHWYDYGSTNQVYDIIWIYEVISEQTCINCGAPNAAMITVGWVSPYCRKCYDKYCHYKMPYEDFIKNENKMRRILTLKSYNPSVLEEYKCRTYDLIPYYKKIFKKTPYTVMTEDEEKVMLEKNE